MNKISLALLGILLLAATGCETAHPTRVSHGGFLETADYDSLNSEAQKLKVGIVSFNIPTKMALSRGDGPAPALVYILNRPLDFAQKQSLGVPDLVVPAGVTNKLTSSIPDKIVETLKKKGWFSEVHRGENPSGLVLRGAIGHRQGLSAGRVLLLGYDASTLLLEFKLEEGAEKRGVAEVNSVHTGGWTLVAIVTSSLEGGFEKMTAEKISKMFEEIQKGKLSGAFPDPTGNIPFTHDHDAH